MPLQETSGAASYDAFGGGPAAVPNYIEDVFSTYLYTGNGSTQTITNGIDLGDKFVGTSTYFNGTAYLSRSSDLSGNSDGKTFTFSAWVYADTLTGGFYIYRSGTGSQFWVVVADDGRVTIRGFDNIDNSSRLNVELPANTVVARQWTNILISFDLTSTSTRYVYVNDAAVTPTYFAYQNYDIDFTNSSHFIAAGSASSGKLTGYVTNIFLDYAYRDLSVTANRRYFIDANKCSTPSSTLSALNPILYLPLTTSTTLNAGSGGNFTANSSPVITNKGTDFSAGYGKGGLVWFKNRGASANNLLLDTVRGASQLLISNLTNSQTAYTGLNSFNSDGFSLNVDPGSAINASSNTYASWTFRKQPKFFDVVTYTGNGSNRTISHNLGSVPGCIIVKRTDTAAAWDVYHRSIANTEYMVLNTTAAKATGTNRWNSTTPTSTEFSLGTATTVNASGGTYVAYLFAHDAGGFGLSGTDNVISCGSFTTDSSGNASVTLGYEPQWIMYKISSTASNWFILDNMRGLAVNTSGGANGPHLLPNLSNAETPSGNSLSPTANGFQANGITPSATYIYIAIRRGPMKVPTSGTSVFSPVARAGTGVATTVASGFVTDLVISPDRGIGEDRLTVDRLRGGLPVYTNTTSAEGAVQVDSFDVMSGFKILGSLPNIDGRSYVNYFFRRAPGFFDEVCYTGTGSYPFTVNHNLGVVPELMVFKKRSANENWWTYAKPLTAPNANWYQNYLVLNTTAARASDTSSMTTSPTSSAITLAGFLAANTATYVVYLFATLAGVSKVGSYTGTGTTQTINCGFTAGSRFVMIKRTNSTGDWYVWDSARGIVAGNDPHLSLNTTVAEVTTDDSVDTDSTGFVVNQLAATNINVTSATYIFLAIA